jgi:2-keto-4-pentenoate hydratase/2-oxohepta-3-ene-1,7-dioic acid hydratase in catechol pathway
VVDLPDAVGHPAFPTTMEALVSSNGGTVLDAARAALERDEAERFVVAGARLLAPLIPGSIRSHEASDAIRPVVGPDDEISWPGNAGWLEYDPKVVAVLGRHAGTSGAGRAVFGYTLVNDWAARGDSGDPVPDPSRMPVALGPCIVTADGAEPQSMFVTARVDGEEWAKGNLNGTARRLLDGVEQATLMETLAPGDGFAMSPFADFREPGARLWPGAIVELEAEGIGTLRNAVGSRR